MEEIKKIEVQGKQYGVADMLMRSVMGGNAQVIEWSHTHNMNDYKDAGTYRIKGERTGNPLDDNLPIMNQGSGHTIDGILYVLDSSLANGSGKSDDCTITQFLMLSNRVGGQEGDMYMRSAYGPTKDSLTWKPWEKYQTNMEVGAVSDSYRHNTSEASLPAQNLEGMDSLIDNGIYSGIYLPSKALVGTKLENVSIADPSIIETFVMVVINNYAAAGDTKSIAQIKFAITNGGVLSMEKRVAHGLYSFGGITCGSFAQWESVVGGGSGLPENVIFYHTGEEDKYYFGYTSPESVAIGSGLVIGDNVRVGCGVTLDTNVKIGEGVNINGVVIENANKSGEFKIKKSNIYDICLEVHAELQKHVVVLGGTGTTFSDRNIAACLGWDSKIGNNVTIPDKLKFSIADNILTITDGTNIWKLTAES